MKFNASDGITKTAQIVGDPARPDSLIYREPTNYETLVKFDYESDTLRIIRSAAKKPFFDARYHLLAADPSPNHASEKLFSWQTYKGGITNVIGMLITNGATMKVEFGASNSIRPGYVMGVAQRSRASTQR